MNDALLSSKNMSWCTPPDFFAELDQEFHFDLDPAATDKSAKCAKYFTPADDVLSKDWGVPRVLQSSVWPIYSGLGAQRLRRKPQAGHSRGYAHTGQNRHELLPRLHIPRQSRRGALFAWASEIHRRGRQRERRGSVPFGCHCMA